MSAVFNRPVNVSTNRRQIFNAPLLFIQKQDNF